VPVTRKAPPYVRAVLGRSNTGTAGLKPYGMFSRLNKTHTSTLLTKSLEN
jgi:hypothetical protein